MTKLKESFFDHYLDRIALIILFAFVSSGVPASFISNLFHLQLSLSYHITMFFLLITFLFLERKSLADGFTHFRDDVKKNVTYVFAGAGVLIFVLGLLAFFNLEIPYPFLTREVLIDAGNLDFIVIGLYYIAMPLVLTVLYDTCIAKTLEISNDAENRAIQISLSIMWFMLLYLFALYHFDGMWIGAMAFSFMAAVIMEYSKNKTSSIWGGIFTLMVFNMIIFVWGLF